MSKQVTSRPELTQERLKELLHYDPDTGIFTWRAPLSRSVKPGQIAGSINCHGYKFVSIDGRNRRAHRLAFLYMTGAFPKDDIDHVNHDKADNRWSNLRAATTSQNIANGSISVANKSGFKGVHWSKICKKWRAIIYVNGKQVSLGFFGDINAAASAYAEAARKYFGEFANPASRD